MKLNNKGYMLVEIIVAFVLAVAIAYYLLNLTYKFKNAYEDVQQSYYYMKDKVLVTKSIMSDLDGAVVSDVSYFEGNPFIIFDVNKDGVQSKKRLLVINNEIEYGTIDNNNAIITSDSSYYKKELESTLVVGNLKVNNESDGLAITIPVQSIYDDNDYSIRIFASK